MKTDNIGALLIALIRTVVPLLVGSLITWLALPESVGELLHLLVLTVVTALYYLAARWLSAQWAIAGWLLGYPTDPTYEPRHAK